MPYEPIEERMMSDYVATRLAGERTVVHLRLGVPRGLDPRSTDYDRLRRLYMVTLLEADLVTRTAGAATIYEFSVWRPQAKLSQLAVYREELPKTPGYEDLTPAEIRLVLVVAEPSGLTAQLAARFDVQLEVYGPPWLLEKLASRRGGR